MTSRPPYELGDSRFTGHVRIQPALNEVELEHVDALVDARGTLRGTPTGRGDRDVPFAHLAWEVCEDGCCLTWSPELEESAVMLPTLRFLIDHLLCAGARAEGRAGFDDFTFDYVLDGAVLGANPWDAQLRLVEVVGNTVTERKLARGCATVETCAPARTSGVTRPEALPKNVIEFRPRRA